ncbi:MAG: GDSL-type esterase/lipase family protein [Chitinophagaceae bacterium]
MKITSRHLKIFLAITVFLNFILGYKVVKAKYFRYVPDITYDRKNLFEHLKMDSSCIVFIGNSLTNQFELTELFRNVKIRNRGINGDNSVGIFDRLQDLIQSQPKKIFIESGINDVLQGAGKEKILDECKKILDKLQLSCKTSKIYVQSILPVYKKGLAIKNLPVKNETIKEINKNLQMYCNDHGITFINLYDKFELNGQMNPKYCIADGLHISAEGYIYLTKLLEPYVNE